jgi:adenosylhomocysteine nucleosidase
MILVSGFNVYPNEVEDVITQMPGVSNARRWACPTRRPARRSSWSSSRRTPTSPRPTCGLLRGATSPATSGPSIVEFRTELPKTPVGKILRRELRDATTTALLLDRFEVDAVLFTGVAGGLGEGVAVGDVVVADTLLQHDMDASPIFPRWEVPLTGRSRFAADVAWAGRLAAAAHRAGHAVHRGLVVSGDRFVSTSAESAALRGLLPDALAVEMEGAAVAQVCHDFGRAFAVMRTISDRADDAAHVDFPRFVANVASGLTRRIVAHALA